MKGGIQIITAHTGSDSTKENSLEFIRFFMDKPVDCIEIDVRSNEYGLYSSHDMLKEGEGPLQLERIFYDMRQFGSHMKLNCDLKELNLERMILDLAKMYGLEENIILSGTVDLENLTELEIQQKVYFNIENLIPGFYELKYNLKQEESVLDLLKEKENQLKDFICYLQDKKVRTVNIQYQFCTADFITIMKESGLRISAWTVNDADEIERLLKEGVYNVTSKIAWQYVKERGRAK